MQPRRAQWRRWKEQQQDAKGDRDKKEVQVFQVTINKKIGQYPRSLSQGWLILFSREVCKGLIETLIQQLNLPSLDKP